MPESAASAAAALLYACPLPRSPLAAVLQPATLNGAILTERRDVHLLHVDAGKATPPETLAGLRLPTTPNTADMPDDETGPVALWLGPKRWLLSFPHGRLPAGEIDAPPGVTVVDLSHGRCVLRLSGTDLSGRAVSAVLAKGCLLDLSPEAFAPGQCIQTLLHAIPVLIHAVDDDVVDLYVARSYAAALWESMV